MGNCKKEIDNFFRGKYSRNEYFSIQTEFEKEHANTDFLFELEQQWNAMKDEPVEGFHQQTTWNEVVRQLGFHPTEKIERHSILAVLQRIAAILFIPLLIGFLVYFYTTGTSRHDAAWAEIICPPGVRTNFRLPDGTSGVLNSESSLKYAINFNSNRKVWLQGQAYFDVVKDKKHPFQVNTGNINIEVLGTSFGILAYPDLANEEVVLKAGKVKISGTNEKTIALLSPNQQFVLDKTQRKYYTENVNAAALTSWIEGKLIFKNERFEDVALRLNRWFHVRIEIKDQELKDYRYYGTFENESLDEVLRLIALTAPIKYEIINRVKLADGTFSNHKIIFTTDEKRMSDFN